MQICRFHVPGMGPRLGLVEGDMVHDLTAGEAEDFQSLSALLAFSAQSEVDLLEALKEGLSSASPAYSFTELDVPPSPSVPHLLSPLDVQEVWAAGVTYLRSREARMGESASATLYDKVYEAERPELFFKATPNRVVGPNDYLYIRNDSQWNAPEPELTLVINPRMELVGFTVGNDMTARDIEGANPLYLSQAKIYLRCCALGPAITLAQEIADPTRLTILCTIYRQDAVVFQGSISTDRMKRSYGELISYLGRDNLFPNGVFLLTGTGIVPPDDFSLKEGDVVEITIEQIGTLRNPIRRVPL